MGIAWDHLNKRIYIADTYNHKIKTVDTATGYCKTLFGAGKPDRTFSVSLVIFFENIISKVTCKYFNFKIIFYQFNEPSGLAVSPDGNILYVADTNNHALKIIDLKNEKISTVSVSKLSFKI